MVYPDLATPLYFLSEVVKLTAFTNTGNLSFILTLVGNILSGIVPPNSQIYSRIIFFL